MKSFIAAAAIAGVAVAVPVADSEPWVQVTTTSQWSAVPTTWSAVPTTTWADVKATTWSAVKDDKTTWSVVEDKKTTWSEWKPETKTTWAVVDDKKTTWSAVESAKQTTWAPVAVDTCKPYVTSTKVWSVVPAKPTEWKDDKTTYTWSEVKDSKTYTWSAVKTTEWKDATTKTTEWKDATTKTTEWEDATTSSWSAVPTKEAWSQVKRDDWEPVKVTSSWSAVPTTWSAVKDDKTTWSAVEDKKTTWYTVKDDKTTWAVVTKTTEWANAYTTEYYSTYTVTPTCAAAKASTWAPVAPVAPSSSTWAAVAAYTGGAQANMVGGAAVALGAFAMLL